MKMDRDGDGDGSELHADVPARGVTRYIHLASLFRRKIELGVWPADQRIPTVDELAQEYGVARATVRQALDVLDAERLIERFRAKGTFVRRRPGELQLWTVATDWSGWVAPDYDAQIELLLEERNVSRRVDSDLGSSAGSYRHVRRRHRKNGIIYLVADVFIDERFSAAITREDLETKPALRLITSVREIEISEARQSITIAAADAVTAEQLRLPFDSTVTYVKREAVDGRGILVMVVDGYYRSDRVRFDMKIR